VPVPPPTTNIMNNYFNSPVEKIEAITEFKNQQMLTLSQSIDEKKRSFELNPNIYNNKLDMNDLIEIIDDISSSSDRLLRMLFDQKDQVGSE
jgi:hypothetical protein